MLTVGHGNDDDDKRDELLIDFYGISIYLEFFYVKRLGKYVPGIFLLFFV